MPPALKDAIRPHQKLGITRRQSMVLEFIVRYCQENGHSPSYQEIADAVGFSSKSGVKRMIDNLVERGRLEAMPRRSRSLVVID